MMLCNLHYISIYRRIVLNILTPEQTQFPPLIHALTLPLSTNSRKGSAVLNSEVENAVAKGGGPEDLKRIRSGWVRSERKRVPMEIDG